MHPRHFAQLLLLSALWGASFPLIRIASPAFGPWGLAGLRCVLAAVVLAALMRGMRQAWPPRAAWPQLAAVGVATVAAPFLLFNAAALVLPAGYSAILNATAPVFSMLAAAAVGDERLSPRRLAGCALGFAGVALLVRLGPMQPSLAVGLGALACVGASAAYGTGSLMMKRASTRHAPLAAAAAVHVVAAVLLLPGALWTAPRMQPTAGAWLALAVLGIFTSGLMYWVAMRLLREIPATAATSSALMIPLFGVTWGGLFLGEPVTTGMLPGAALVLLAAALITGFLPRPRRPASP